MNKNSNIIDLATYKSRKKGRLENKSQANPRNESRRKKPDETPDWPKWQIDIAKTLGYFAHDCSDGK